MVEEPSTTVMEYAPPPEEIEEVASNDIVLFTEKATSFPASIVGRLWTIPDPVGIVMLVAPELVQEIFPLAPFEAKDVNLTYTYEEATVPENCVKVTADPNPEPEVLETS